MVPAPGLELNSADDPSHLAVNGTAAPLALAAALVTGSGGYSILAP